MNELIFKISVGSIIVSYLIWRFIYSPKFTHIALERFIIDSLGDKSFEDFHGDHSEKINVRNRTAHARWRSRRDGETSGILVRFEVRPSVLPVSISASQCIRIPDAPHFEQMQIVVRRSGDFSPFVADDDPGVKS